VTGEILDSRRKKRDAVLGILLIIGVGVALPLQGSTYAAVVGNVILVVCALVVLLRLHAAVRRAVGATSGAPLVAATRGPERVDTVPAELRRVVSDIARTRESTGQYEKTLAPRLERLGERRARLAGGQKTPPQLVPRGGLLRRPARRGLTVGEIDRIVRTIEEL
jgi:hypothetical protein